MNTRVRKADVQVGDIVTCRWPERTYAARPVDRPVFFEPGDLGVVGAVDVPAVTGRERSFVCVDFRKAGCPCNAPHRGGTDPNRAGLFYENIIIVQKASERGVAVLSRPFIEGLLKTREMELALEVDSERVPLEPAMRSHYLFVAEIGYRGARARFPLSVAPIDIEPVTLARVLDTLLDAADTYERAGSLQEWASTTSRDPDEGPWVAGLYQAFGLQVTILHLLLEDEYAVFLSGESR